MPELKQKRSNELIQAVMGKFVPHFFPDAKVLLVGDAGDSDCSSYVKFAWNIAWETEVWIADAPEHLIHYNGTRFLGPYES